MHEMSLCEGIRDVIEDQARIHAIKAVKRVRLEIGSFSGVEKKALEFAFDVVMRGSVAEGALLEMLDLPGRAMCYDCMKEVEIDDRLAPCPECGGGKLMPVSGDEMRIKDLEVI
ncbi:hydrogenase nickel incorporation protein HybF [Thalassovita gelatinovora]|uniref:Hydrogenase maturation factor HypA n=1 Tax=Thalassovita gelatinovora TaxID=53501 RepID=A0A0P1FKC9_THAGE|nr:hydrogenase maturation nickel metallochaperone HypA [Thalassovita gelatinovora]QIZ82389.1 hydrogenase maturation nickel metallochaperone HypA [Thalassovita gelatinovora]CUH68470.1 hydrogenase nickel incorporation protein HybF [Thalassovita gelatinovora]SEQ52854.1 hydrogenase nickel incorporation protein HypA/HybF [Thalassovita gelatinovora]